MPELSRAEHLAQEMAIEVKFPTQIGFCASPHARDLADMYLRETREHRYAVPQQDARLFDQDDIPESLLGDHPPLGAA
jgi:hypothetical protein